MIFFIKYGSKGWDVSEYESPCWTHIALSSFVRSEVTVSLTFLCGTD